MAPKLTSWDVFGMFLKYWLSTERGFGGDDMNPGGVLVSGCGLLWLLVSVGGDMTRSWEKVVLCEACCCDVCWLCCCVGFCCELWAVCL